MFFFQDNEEENVDDDDAKEEEDGLMAFAQMICFIMVTSSAWVSHQPDSTPSQSSPNKVTIGSSSLIKLKSAFIRVAVSLPIAFLNIYKQGRR